MFLLLPCASCAESSTSLSRRCVRGSGPSGLGGCLCEACDSPRDVLARHRPWPGLLYPSGARTSSVHHTRGAADPVAGRMSSEQLRVMYGKGVRSARGALCVLRIVAQPLTDDYSLSRDSPFWLDTAGKLTVCQLKRDVQAKLEGCAKQSHTPLPQSCGVDPSSRPNAWSWSQSSRPEAGAGRSWELQLRP